ncbi:PP2C family serine/threonine-protein phosphatase [Cytobacillus sp. FJAT-54145]|uniref:PP2C family serine/threonine-protein phosphatase n=1 Tax=Cytobacillus spartinae TaxID=3299023 RepID=A0ABW6KFU4_9BACI
MTNSSKQRIEVIAHQTTKQGKTQCGDDYYFSENQDYFICVLADGLGSGPNAFESSSEVIKVVKNYHHEDVNSMMTRCNDVLFQKRGAAVAILKVDYKNNEFIYSCVGNIRFFLYSSMGKLTYPLPVTGYLSGKPQRFNTQRFPYESSSKFLLYSDGFDVQGVKGLLKSYSSIENIAEEIKSKYSSSADDATFIIGNLL